MTENSSTSATTNSSEYVTLSLDKDSFEKESRRLARIKSNTNLQETPTAFVHEKVLLQQSDRIRLVRHEWKKQGFETWWQSEAVHWTVPKNPHSFTQITLPEIRKSSVNPVSSWDPQGSISADTWKIPDLPAERYQHSAVWTGTEMIVWGGWNGAYLNTGGRYDPVTDIWTATSLSGAPSPRSKHTAIWTGSEMIVWGGIDATPYIAAPQLDTAPAPLKALSNGSRYNPMTDSWTPMAPAAEALTDHTAVWTGNIMIVWGGREISGDVTDIGGRYDPSTDTWSGISSTGVPSSRFHHSAVWTDNRMIVFGGQDISASTLNDGAMYDPAANTWTTITGAPVSLQGHTAVWTGSQMIVWGGGDGTSTTNKGGVYTPSTDSWTNINLATSPLPRTGHTAIWTGNRMIIWGGVGADGVNNSGASYNPVNGQWTAINTTNAPSARTGHTAIWTGTEMIAWGGWDKAEDATSHSGGRYDPAADSWQATASQWSPRKRSGHSAIWTGNEMIIWGGREWSQLDSGGRYDPITDLWTPVSQVDAPAARQAHTAVWTGTEMLIWGGDGWDGNTVYMQDGGRYNPITDSWQAVSIAGAPSVRNMHTAVWSGNEMIVWGGWNGSIYLGSGGRYDPAADSWAILPSGSLAARIGHTAVWSGSAMLIWGGYYYDSDFVYLQTGAKYDPTTNDWTPISTISAPSPRAYHSAIATEQGMIVWGGKYQNGSGMQFLRTGGRYNTATDTWYATAITNAPARRALHTAVWAPDQKEMIIWGGEKSDTLGDLVNTGGRYNPITNTWTPVSQVAAPVPRSGHSAVWTGKEMIIWGGFDVLYTPRQSMGIYYPYSSYMVGGTVTGLAPGTSVVVQNNLGDDLIVSTDGSFVFDTEMIDGSSYEVTVLTQPLSPKKICNVNNGNGNINGADITSVNIVCSDLFSDVGVDYWAYDWIQALGAAGITQGCGAGNYCPADNVNRGEMAVFLERSMNGEFYTPPAATGTIFTDVPVTQWAAAWIEQLASDGITSGCGGGKYCPDNDVTRAEMAVFLLRAEHGANYTPPPATGTNFDDIPVSHWASGWIEQLASEGVTSGCDSSNYCPDAQVTRAEMAVFLVRTFNL
ncbi:Kelch repeat-containing protein [Thiolapillus sp.]